MHGCFSVGVRLLFYLSIVERQRTEFVGWKDQKVDEEQAECKASTRGETTNDPNRQCPNQICITVCTICNRGLYFHCKPSIPFVRYRGQYQYHMWYVRLYIQARYCFNISKPHYINFYVWTFFAGLTLACWYILIHSRKIILGSWFLLLNINKFDVIYWNCVVVKFTDEYY